MKRDFDDLVGRWLADEAPLEAPDWIVQSVADRTAQLPHRRSRLAFLGHGPASVLIGTSMVAVVLALAFLAGIGFGELVRVGGERSPTASPPPAATASPTAGAFVLPARPTDVPTDGSCEPDRQCFGLLEPGSYRTEFLDPNFSFEIAESGWVNTQSSGGELNLLSLESPGDELVFLQRPSARSAGGQAIGGIGSSVEELAAFLAGRTDLVVEGPTPAAVGGLQGVQLDVVVELTASDAVNGCPAEPCVMLAGALDPAEMPSWLWQLTLWRGAAMRIWILDAGTHRVLLVATAWDGSQLDELGARVQPIVNSLQFVE